MPNTIKTILRFILFAGIGVTIMYFLFTNQQESYFAYCKNQSIPINECSLWEKLKTDFLSIKWGWIILVFVGFVMTNVSRAIRWQIILNTMNYKIDFWNSWGTINVAYLANLGLPRAGELVRAVLISKYETIPVDKAFASVALDRIVDIFSFIIIVCLAIILDFSTFHTFFNQYASLDGMSSKLNLLLVILLLGTVLWFTRNVWKNFAVIKKVIKFLEGFWEGISSIRHLSQFRKFLFHTILIWIWFYLMLVFAMKSFEPTSQLSFLQMLVVYVFGSFGVFIPSPGGMGTYHYLVIISLGLYGINEVDAFSFANIAFTTGQFLALFIFGLLSLILLPIYNKKQNNFK